MRGGGQFGAVAAALAAGVVVLLLVVAQVQAAAGLGGGQAGAALAGGVVEDELVVAPVAALAGAQFLGLDAAEDGVVRVLLGALAFAGEPRGRVAGGLGGARGFLVVLGVDLAGAVVQRGDDHGAVDVAVVELHQHFLAHARQTHLAPVVAGGAGGHAHPGAQAVGGGRVVLAVGARLARARRTAALPVELHLDAVVAVGVHRRIGTAHADDDGALAAVHAGLGMDALAVAVQAQRPVGDGRAHGGELVAVVGDGVCGRIAVAAVEHGRDVGQAQPLADAGLQVFVEVVARDVAHGQHGEAAVLFAVLVVLLVSAQRERRGGRQGTHGAAAFEALVAQLQRLQGVGEQALALRGGLPAVGAGVVAPVQGALARGAALLLHGACVHALVVPALLREAVGLQLAMAAPLLDGVFALAGIGAVETNGGLRVGAEGAVVVGDDEGVAAQRTVLARGVFEPVAQALFRQQPRDEVEVAFLVLGGDAAHGVDVALGDLPAPLRRELALALVATEHGVDDVEHVLVLEQAAVLAIPQEGDPRFDDEPVARHAAVARHALGLAHMAVEGAQLGAALRGLQIEPHALPDEGLEFDVRVVAQRGEFEAKAAAVDALHAVQALGQQLVLAQRRVQHQQAIALRGARAHEPAERGRCEGRRHCFCSPVGTRGGCA
ncbi:hypothetical protein D3C87_613060 [compost metagenome]